MEAGEGLARAARVVQGDSSWPIRMGCETLGRGCSDSIVLARSQGTQPAPIGSVSPQQFMKVVRAVLAALRS